MSFRVLAHEEQTPLLYALVWSESDLRIARKLSQRLDGGVVVCESPTDIRLAQRGPLADALALPGELWQAPPARRVGKLTEFDGGMVELSQLQPSAVSITDPSG